MVVWIARVRIRQKAKKGKYICEECVEGMRATLQHSSLRVSFLQIPGFGDCLEQRLRRVGANSKRTFLLAFDVTSLTAVPCLFRTYEPLKSSGNYTYHLLYPISKLAFLYMCFICFSEQTLITSLNSINQLILVMVDYSVLFEVRTEFLNIFRPR
jgi:hypothetical protein